MKHIRAADIEFPRLLVGNRYSSRIQQSDGHTWQGRTNAAGSAFTLIWVAQVHECLCHPIPLENCVAEAATTCFVHMGRKWCRTANEQPHLLTDGSGRFLGHFQHANIDCWNAKEKCGTEVKEGFSGFRTVKALLQPHPATAGDPAVQSISQAMYVKER